MMRSLRTTVKSSPHSLQLEKGYAAVKTQHSQKSVNKIIRKKKEEEETRALSLPCEDTGRRRLSALSKRAATRP